MLEKLKSRKFIMAIVAALVGWNKSVLSRLSR